MGINEFNNPGIIQSPGDGAEKTCKTCRWHDDFSLVCFNGCSPHCADFTDNDSICKQWEHLKGVSKKVKAFAHYWPSDGSPFTTDIIFCDTADCPFTECMRHSENLKGHKESVFVALSNFGVSCLKYNGWLVLNAEKTHRENLRREVEEQLG